MATFSERRGIVQKTPIQREAMNGSLRTALWNLLYPKFKQNLYYAQGGYGRTSWRTEFAPIINSIWKGCFKLKINTLSKNAEECLKHIERTFDNFQWNEVYDFLEHIFNNFDDDYATNFAQECNIILEQESSAYRFIGKFIIDIISQQEIESIEDALASPYPTVNAHIETALKLLSDKKHPDYRNSVKESISAVEGLVKIVSKQPKGKLGALIKSLNLHPAFQEGLNKIYGYTSDDGGIRHPLIENGNIPTHADALFLLVMCSAFINYIIQKCNKN